jgi:hypothetical protein
VSLRRDAQNFLHTMCNYICPGNPFKAVKLIFTVQLNIPPPSPQMRVMIILISSEWIEYWKGFLSEL